MAFQPFGYRFEVSYLESPTEIRAIISKKRTSWFDAKNGARGWTLGPILCLWFSAFDKHGPMLFGLIRPTFSGTKIYGRAGSDLNGILAFTLLLPGLILLTAKLHSENSATLGSLVTVGIIVFIGGPLAYWIAHKDRKSAEPLIRFLQNLTRPRPAPTAEQDLLKRTSRAVTMIENELVNAAPITVQSIGQALDRMGAHDVLVLEIANETYIQTICLDGASFLLEKREGNAASHYRAFKAIPTAKSAKTQELGLDEINQALLAYASDAPAPTSFSWERVVV